MIKRIKDVKSKDLIGKFSTEISLGETDYELEIISSRFPLFRSLSSTDERYCYAHISIWDKVNSIVYKELFTQPLQLNDIIEQHDYIMDNLNKFIPYVENIIKKEQVIEKTTP